MVRLRTGGAVALRFFRCAAKLQFAHTIAE
jgi:hypothetical protein